jgi:hypothetical protein
LAGVSGAGSWPRTAGKRGLVLESRSLLELRVMATVAEAGRGAVWQAGSDVGEFGVSG